MAKHCATGLILLMAVTSAGAQTGSVPPGPPGLKARVYHLGNSLTRNIPLERLRQLFESAGVLNFYADGIHLNDQPHNADDSGTIGSYVAALTIYATLSRKSPDGLTAKPYEQFDEKADAILSQALQQTVWDVVAGHRRTGVPKP